MREWRNNSAHS